MVDFLNKYLILETVEQQLKDAINAHHTITVYYKGHKGKTKDASDHTDSGQEILLFP